MKKAGLLLLAMSVFLSLLWGCADKEREALVAETAFPVTDSRKPVDADPQPDRSPYNTPYEMEIEIVEERGSGDISVDVDLTALSSTMVYAEVYNMMTEPESYIGKAIKIRGLYYATYYEPTKQYYHFVVIQDATACCAQGLEFIWLEHVYPNDFPEDETEIEITGVWESYEEEGQTYYHIMTDAVKVVQN